MDSKSPNVKYCDDGLTKYCYWCLSFAMHFRNFPSEKKIGSVQIIRKEFRTLGSDDLKVFECFRVSFSLKKLSYFHFRSIFICNKKESQSCQFATYRRNALLEFLTSQTRDMAFAIFKVIISQLCISLTHQPKVVRYFEYTLIPLTEIIFLS